MSKDGQTISEYMAEYPCLKKPTGYLLVSMKYIKLMDMYEFNL